ncbi:ribosome-inactivating family protein [Streptomyces ipomoeae]|uniref:ribosome-inactivating family protein n=1 Tax=Streptomyces ipomoeae TaxID=103232 RepID=UPI0015F02976|nr:ribosome-inactivating family protein [Streptomyces ipomoeae]MDX2939128.1 ribosome-inactivating family protein [Streptomyces ipomoeae]
MMTHPDPDSSASPKLNAGRHKRGSRWLNKKFLAFFLVAAVLLGGGALVVPQFQDKASAIDDKKDISWDMSGGTNAYNAMIEAVRKRATERGASEGSPTLREGILRTNPTNTGLFSIDVVNRNVGQSSTDPVGFRLLMRASDLFIVGWLIATPDGAEQVFFLQGEDEARSYRGQTKKAKVVDIPFSGSYTDLERAAGRGRSGTTVNSSVWDNAFRNMIATVTGESDEETVARALLMFIPAIAEAARFDPIQAAFAPTFQNGEHTILPAEALLMNNWSKASKQTTDSLDTGSAIDFTIDDPATPAVDYKATSLTSMAAILAICLLQSKS